ncbi:MAG: MATE family efflux transporter [Rikenellaceae bacterium]|nr:MATE family efflux transporter [Rikenellaceae bacterium]
MEYGYGKIWKITYPVLISLLMQQLIGITDTAFLGRVGDGVVALGASALGGIFYLVMYVIGFGFSVGAEILMGRRNGEKQYSAIGEIFGHGMVFLMALALAMFVISEAFAPAILGASISSDAVYDATIIYTRWRVAGLFFSFAGIMFRAFYMSVTNTRILTVNSLVMVASNVVLNYLLIFGKLGFPELGIAGAAIASVISEVISMLFFIVYTRRIKDHRIYGLMRRRRLKWSVQKQILSVSGWTMIQFFASCGTWLFFFVAIEHLGDRSLAISNIVRNVSALLYLFVSAFATTGSAMVSNLMGKGKQDEVMPLCGRIIKMSAVCTLPLILFAALFPQAIIRIYTDNPGLIESSIPSLMVMLGAYIVAVPAYVYFLAISGTGNTRVTLWIELFILSIYVSYTWLTAIHLRTDIAVVWVTESIYHRLLLVICWL